MTYTLTIRRDTRAEWVKYNPVLALGEPAFVTDEDKFYIGDGTTAFTGLQPINKDVVVTWDDVTGKPTFSAVATSGSYNDLTDKPEGLATETYVDNAVAVKADKADTYTKTEVNALIPDVSAFITKSVNDLENYYTKSTTYTKAEVDQIVSAIHNLKIEIVSVLPATGDTNTIYLVPKATAASNDVYDEYLYVSNNWEHIGSTEIDLSNYYTKAEVDAKFTGVKKSWYGTKAEYDALTEKDVNTNYYIEGSDVLETVSFNTASSDKLAEVYEAYFTNSGKEYNLLYTYINETFSPKFLKKFSDYVEFYYNFGSQTTGSSTKSYTASIMYVIRLYSNGSFERMITDIGYSGNGTITVQQGETEQTFTLNQDTNQTITIDAVPTKTSELTNDSNYTTTDYVDSAVSGKADKTDTYTKTEVETKLNTKANASDVYTKQQVDAKDWYGTQAEYDAIATKDPNVTYHIEGGSSKIVPVAPTLDLSEPDADVADAYNSPNEYLLLSKESDSSSLVYGFKHQYDGWQLWCTYKHYGYTETPQYATDMVKLKVLPDGSYVKWGSEAVSYVYNNKITIKQGDTEQTFTLNQSSDKTITLTEGGSGGNEWYGTQAEFDALTEEELSQDTTYFIKDKLDWTEIANTPIKDNNISGMVNDADYVSTARMKQSINSAINKAVKQIEAKHQWLTQAEYDTLVEEDALVAGTQYHIEGDQKTEELVFTLEDGTTRTLYVYTKENN